MTLLRETRDQLVGSLFTVTGRAVRLMLLASFAHLLGCGVLHEILGFTPM
jgi:hypothetical protein